MPAPLALDRNDRRVVVLLARAAEARARVTVPATALAQAIRRPERQVRLARLLRQPTTDVVPLDRLDATAVGSSPPEAAPPTWSTPTWCTAPGGGPSTWSPPTRTTSDASIPPWGLSLIHI